MDGRRNRITEVRTRVAILCAATFAAALGAVDLWGSHGAARGASAAAAPAASASASLSSSSSSSSAGAAAPAPMTTRQS